MAYDTIRTFPMGMVRVLTIGNKSRFLEALQIRTIPARLS